MKPYTVVKRVLDIIFAFILLIVSSPIMLVAAFSIRIESEGPILFKQKRPGKNEKIFMVYKFRTMRIEQQLKGIQLSDMNRITKIGSFLRKTSIDELPQLINIIRGDMSFIGPRPLLVEYLERYSSEEKRRHEVTPGISGWAQVNGRNSISWDQKFKYDVWYVDNANLFLDTKILWLTIYNVFNKKDINNSQLDTMPLFMGNSEAN